MGQQLLTEDAIRAFQDDLILEEKSGATLEKYLRDIRAFSAFAGERSVTKELVMAYKQSLLERGYAVRSINSMLASINGFLDFLGWQDCKVKSLKLQNPVYCAEEKELTKAEYLRLLAAAEKHPRLRLILETICGTGIRVSELRYFTVEGVQCGEISVRCKSKTRTILLPGKLRRLLLAYAKKSGIRSGEIFVTRSGKPLNRSNIWAQMKALCEKAGVKASKVFPHNLRKLFARTFLRGGKGHRQAGGHPGPQQHQHHQNLYHDHRCGAPPENRAPGTGPLESHNQHYVVEIKNGRPVAARKVRKNKALLPAFSK